MKKLLFTGVLLSAAATGLGQGRISFQNDSLHLVYFITDTAYLLPGDISNAGEPTSLALGRTLTAELWGGTSSTALTLQATNGMSPVAGCDGLIATKNFIGSGTVAGVPNFFQVRVYSTAAGSFAGALMGYGYYWGETSIFTAIPSTSAIAYNSIVNPGSHAYSTWLVGTQDESSSVWGSGAKGAIPLYASYPPPPPYISVQPTSQVVTVGAPASLSVATFNVQYWQWHLNGTNIAGATSSVYALASAQLTNAGTYSVTVWNSYGFYSPVTSSDAVLQVLPPNAPSIRVNGALAVGTVTSTGTASVTMSGGFAGGSIFYALDGTTPSTNSTLYTGPISLTHSATVRAMSASADYSQSAQAPTVQVHVANWWSLHGADLVLGWTTPWVLQDATNVLGPFHDVPGATSPYATNVLLHPQLFFRWRQ